MNEQTRIGAAIRGYRAAAPGEMSASEAADAVLAMDPAVQEFYAAAAGYTNGTCVATEHNKGLVRKALGLPPAPSQPTHALDAPPDLTEADAPPPEAVVEAPLDPRRSALAELFTGEHVVPPCRVCRRDTLKAEDGWTCLNTACTEFEKIQD